MIGSRFRKNKNKTKHFPSTTRHDDVRATKSLKLIRKKAENKSYKTQALKTWQVSETRSRLNVTCFGIKKTC